jgi:hypothetical protein
MKNLKTISILSALITVAACATIVNGSKSTVYIDSNVPNTTVSVNGQKKMTPAVFELKGTSEGYLVEASKKGYEDTTARVDSTFRTAPAILGNILWLEVGLIVDIVDGAAYGLDKNVTVNMVPKGKSMKEVTAD